MATANTFVQIGSTVTVGSGGAATINFTNIPSTYTDLVVKCSMRTDYTSSSYGYVDMKFNGSAASFTSVRLLGYSTAANSSSATQFSVLQDSDSATASIFANMEIYIPNYSGSSYKSISVDGVTENNLGTAEAAFCALMAGLWSSTSAINQLTFSPWSGYGTNFKQYSTASLYGILKY